MANFRALRVEAETKAMLIFSMTHIWRFLEIIDLQFSTRTTKLNIPTADNDISKIEQICCSLEKKNNIFQVTKLVVFYQKIITYPTKSTMVNDKKY